MKKLVPCGGFIIRSNMENQQDQALRDRLIAHIEGGEAFLNMEHLLERMPYERLSERPDGLPYSFYELFYHVFLAQRDLLEYSKDSRFESPSWPEGYWPSRTGPSSKDEWEELQDAFFKDRAAFKELLRDPQQGLQEPFLNGTGHTLFRQALLVIEHAAYHIGQLWIIMRRLGLHS